MMGETRIFMQIHLFTVYRTKNAEFFLSAVAFPFHCTVRYKQNSYAIAKRVLNWIETLSCVQNT